MSTVTLSRIEQEVDYFADRDQALIDVRNDVLEAAREEGANTAVGELIKSAVRAKRVCITGDTRAFLATFCGAIEDAFPDLARALAEAAGMNHLYAEEN